MSYTMARPGGKELCSLCSRSRSVAREVRAAEGSPTAICSAASVEK
jgi:hypothetical protein